MLSNTIKMDLDVKKEGFLWLSRKYHKNWRAYLNGENVPLNQTRANFLSIFLPRGQNQLVLRYRRMSTQKMIMFLSLILLMVCCYIFLVYTDIHQALTFL